MLNLGEHFVMLNLGEHEVFPACKCLYANNCYIYKQEK